MGVKQERECSSEPRFCNPQSFKKLDSARWPLFVVHRDAVDIPQLGPIVSVEKVPRHQDYTQFRSVVLQEMPGAVLLSQSLDSPGGSNTLPDLLLPALVRS